MKINFLFPAVASAVLAASSMAVTTQSVKTMHLMSAMGHQNVTTMQALVQEIADESVNEPGWKFDDDIKLALHAIRDTFVKSIQKALKDQHKRDQEHFNCFTKDCFGDCISGYNEDENRCKEKGEECDGLEAQHDECRQSVYEQYVEMATDCAKLHCFEIPDPPCLPEDCLCPDLTSCHKKNGEGKCEANAGDCKANFGGWLQGQITRYRSAWEEWQEIYDKCKVAYHGFLTKDMECDATQKEFEKCSCDKNRCEYTTCEIDFKQCNEQCWGRYDELVKEKECLEKDRKIDWSATKKIECYLDVLLHDYTQQELQKKCGTDDCVNKAREEDYKHCAKVCPEIDYDGEWPRVLSVDPGNVKIAAHSPREHVSEYLLGDERYECDVNGAEVFTKHRGGVDREDEDRCTEHLDFDYQIPECITPECKKVPVCDAAFHKKHYAKFDRPDVISSINECCPDESSGQKSCFGDVTMQSSSDGEKLSTITISEHTLSWAYNRCPCMECQEGFPVYSPPPENHQCGAGAHGFSRICPEMACMMHCEHGKLKDENGCELCNCAPPPFKGPRIMISTGPMTSKPSDAGFEQAVENAVRKRMGGYCSKEVQEVDYNNNKLCGGGNRNIAYKIEATFMVDVPGTWHFDFNVDFGWGGVVTFNGERSHEGYYPGDLWWSWNHNRALPLDIEHNFETAGPVTMVAYGGEGCCDGRSNIYFTKPGGERQIMSIKNLLTPIIEEPIVVFR